MTPHCLLLWHLAGQLTLNWKHHGQELRVSWKLKPEDWWQMPWHLGVTYSPWLVTHNYLVCIKDSHVWFLKQKQPWNSRHWGSFCEKGHPAGTEATGICHCWWLSVITFSNNSTSLMSSFLYSALHLHSHCPSVGHIPCPPEVLDVFPTRCLVSGLLLSPPLYHLPCAQLAKGAGDPPNLPIWPEWLSVIFTNNETPQYYVKTKKVLDRP